MLGIAAARPTRPGSASRHPALRPPAVQEQEDVLTKLREFWNISNTTHSVRRGAGAPRQRSPPERRRR